MAVLLLHGANSRMTLHLPALTRTTLRKSFTPPLANGASSLSSTHATCHRHEEYYEPLQRQWNFGMREIVCIGTADEVKEFLESYEAKVNDLVSAAGIDIDWEDATDPFFNPSKNPKYLAQKLDPVKKEMIYEGKLAIGSTNFHRNYFGEAFNITAGGEDAFSGCVAFGLERWMYAILKQFGTSPESWPDLRLVS